MLLAQTQLFVPQALSDNLLWVSLLLIVVLVPLDSIVDHRLLTLLHVLEVSTVLPIQFNQLLVMWELLALESC